MTKKELDDLLVACGLAVKGTPSKLEGGIKWWHPLAIMAVLYISYRLTLFVFPSL